jgi:hypothetical protein
MADRTQIIEPRRGLTFDDVWAAIIELRESQKDTDRQIKETGRKLGELGNRFGELAEHLVAPNIKEKFNALGYHFDGILKDREISGPDGAEAEIDILLENEDFSIAVEVKATLRERDIDAHIQRLEILRRYMDRHHDTKKLRGAVAGAIVSPETRKYALKNGFYVIEQTGDTVKIEVPADFTPREW